MFDEALKCAALRASSDLRLVASNTSDDVYELELPPPGHTASDLAAQWPFSVPATAFKGEDGHFLGLGLLWFILSSNELVVDRDASAAFGIFLEELRSLAAERGPTMKKRVTISRASVARVGVHVVGFWMQCLQALDLVSFSPDFESNLLELDLLVVRSADRLAQIAPVALEIASRSAVT
eukprot:TRINITY_DN8667_c0_g1_i1.p1 TRINITY_DN8667_c0_g1~~TRINITY_DN8667_c0_g1_i1.p1  ORF type:complete len:180 (-),score=14.70 TRINITY_DN8667_c0_g1_i1:91-630(-)